MRVLNGLMIVGALIFIGMLAWQEYSPNARACQAKGGRYYLHGGCARVEVVKIPL